MLRNIYTGKLARVVSRGRHRVTVRLSDGSVDEWLIDEVEVSQEGSVNRPLTGTGSVLPFPPCKGGERLTPREPLTGSAGKRSLTVNA